MKTTVTKKWGLFIIPNTQTVLNISGLHQVLLTNNSTAVKGSDYDNMVLYVK